MAYNFKDLVDLGNWLAYYSDDSWATKFEYFCMPAQPNAALTDKSWKIMRMETDKTTTDMIQWKAIKMANGDCEFDNVATDLATVAALTYI